MLTLGGPAFKFGNNVDLRKQDLLSQVKLTLRDVSCFLKSMLLLKSDLMMFKIKK